MEAFCGSPFWVPLGTVEGRPPNVSPCFQHTVLIWTPAFALALLLPVFFFQTKRTSVRFEPLPWTALLILRLIINTYLAANSLAVLIFSFTVQDSTCPADILYPLLRIAFFLAQFWMDIRRRQTGMVSSGIQHLSLLFLTICALPEFYQWIVDRDTVFSTALFIAFMAYWPVMIVQVVLYGFADRRRYSETTKPSVELDSSYVNRLTITWFTPLLVRGAKKDLEMEDMFELNPGSESAILGPEFEKYWIPVMKEYMKNKDAFNRHHQTATDNKARPPVAPSIVYCLFRMFKFELLTAFFLKLLSDTIQFANPFLLNLLLGFISDPSAPLWLGLSYAIAMLLASEIRSLVLNYYFFLMFRIGIKLQTALTTAVYKKTMRLSNSARREKTVGEIINLMAIDVDTFQMVTWQIQQLWSCPYQLSYCKQTFFYLPIIFCLVYVFYTLGYSASPGVVIMALFIPLNIGGSLVIKKWQTRQMKLKDERTKMINEVLNGIKVIKLYAWEVPMEEHVANIRDRELALIKKASVVKNLLDTFNTASPFMVAACSLATYTLTSGQLLTPQVAFVSLTLFNQLRSPMTMIAILINMLVQALVSNRRLKAFFVSDELDGSVVNKVKRTDDAANAVEVNALAVSWDEPSAASEMPKDLPSKSNGNSSKSTPSPPDRPTLEDVTFSVDKGGFLAVVGSVGAGKSSLLSALLGELTKLRGSITVVGRVAYFPQQAWIQNLTLRDNILFGRPYNKKLYDQVIYACALKADLAILPNGDLTEIGEKGINLSGGQKARVALARAVYQENDVYLLDDPLSAVDAHVGRHIYNQVIGPHGMLANNSRILVTHGLSFTRAADEILFLEDGRIVERGSYSSLVEMSGRFAKLLEEKKKEEPEDEEEEESIEEKASLDDESPPEVISEVQGTKANGKVFEKQISILSQQSKGDGDKKLIEKENVEVGRVKTLVYADYMRAAGFTASACFVGFFTLFTILQCGRSFWLSAWSDENDETRSPNATKMSLGGRLGGYIGFGVAESLCFLLSLVSLVYAGLNASRNLHAPLVHNLLRSPISFFDTTPLGRILNRCSKDIETVDSQLPLNFRYFLMCMLQVASTILIIAISTPLFTVVIIPLTIIYFFILRFYVPSSRQLKRLESVHRSPIYSHFGESISGAASIRAYDRVDDFCAYSEATTDRFMRCRHMNTVSNRWLGVRLEFIGNLVIFFAALFAAFSKELGWGVSAGIVGVSVSYALNITEVLNFAVRQISMVESNIVSVERVKEYCETANEAEWERPEKRPGGDWPSTGAVRFERYATRYREGLDLVLRNITAVVGGGEKIGIVGRTGAGKSSFALALFRMIEPAAGRILIDGVDIAELGLHDLRKILTIIPQDPVLFSGSLRFNLDPFGEYDDAALWKALELAHLKTFVAGLPDGLAHVISEGGENISVGQRQLVCLARAALRHSHILVLDEATAAVDLQTDSLIQNTIRTRFRECTVFTIAHRLNTILDYDRIMVLDKGEIIEFDSPIALQADRNSAFSRMLEDAAAEGKQQGEETKTA